jgi:subtilase family serine protease
MDSPLLIEFTATVIDEIAITPQQFWFKDAEVGKKSRIVLSVNNNGKEPLRLTGWRTQLEGFVLTLPSGSIDPGKSAEIVAEFTPAKPAPIISDAVFLNTSNQRQPEVYLPVYGNAREFKFE